MLFISIPAVLGLMAVSLSMVQVLCHISFAQAQSLAWL
ncbi:hypothetical protein Krac_10597 [Ktedonobacter racemifer DSM 44963]|uniref:Uncharacterized protein n=1 Tax=Ktedonobacter racemifer DSM 44963 TaxID=485913 RepID=D6THR6_KTERA|nr:hypothetical protein Krac_10597 [Ktedonobacter racemifer DSM 44963]